MLTEQEQKAPLLLAIQTGTPNYVRLLLQYRAVPELPDEVTGSDVPSQAKSQEMTRVMQLASSFPEIGMLLEAAIKEHWFPGQVRATLQGLPDFH